MEKELYAKMRERVLGECVLALGAIAEADILKYLEMIRAARKVFFVGVGRVALSLQAIAKRYAHLGIDTVVVGQITEPAITPADLLIVGSGSGETLYPAGIAKKAKMLGAGVIHIGSNPASGLRRIADLFVRIPVESRAQMDDEIHSQQPMTSLFEQALLLLGDITAMMMIEDKKIDTKALWRYHANLE